MSEHVASIQWQLQGPFSHEGFNRSHNARISGHTLPMSGANTPDYADPEQTLAAALASCHMQTFLLLAAKKRLTVVHYQDTAIATVEQNDTGRMYVSNVLLQPKATFSGEKQPSQDEIEGMHHKAHDHCFVSNSLISQVNIAPQFV